MINYDIIRLRRIFKEGSLIIIGQIATVAGSFVLIRVLTEYMQPDEYGKLALGLTIATLVNQVATGGVTSGIGRFYSIASKKGDLRGYLRASIWLMGFATLGIIFIANALILGLLAIGQLHWVGLSIAVLVFAILCGFNSAFNSIQNAARQRAIVALHSGLNAWLKIGIAVCMILWSGANSTAVVIGYGLSVFIVTLSQLIFLKRLLRYSKRVFCSESINDWVGQIWSFSWPMMAGGVFNWGYYASQRWALELFASTAEVGKFYALTQIAYTPISIAGSLLMSFLVPILYARAADPKNYESINNVRSVVFKITGLSVGGTLLLAGIAYFFHVKIFGLLVAKQYQTMSIFMPIVIIASGLLQSSISLGSILTTSNQTRAVLPLAVYGNMLIIITNLILTKYFGIMGLLISMVLSSMLHFSWMIYIIHHVTMVRTFLGTDSAVV